MSSPDSADGHQPPSSVRARRTVAETGSFGKSTRRARSRSGTVRGAREDPTQAGADKVFGDFLSKRAPPRKTAPEDDDAAAPSQRAPTATPVEVVLRGFRSSSQQWAAISHYENIAGAGTILEDYPRGPPPEQRKYQSSLRDSAYTTRRTLTAAQKPLVNTLAGGEHWIKITFDSIEAADAAMSSSPQRIQGFLVHAERYRGVPPKDEACPDMDVVGGDFFQRSKSTPAGLGGGMRNNASMPTSFSSRLLDLSPPGSRQSSQTLETATMSSVTITDAPPTRPSTTGVETAMQEQQRDADGMFCRAIPTARRARLLPAEQALLPQQTFWQRVLNTRVVSWFGGSMIGNEVPRTDSGDFDWYRASLYWKVIWWLDVTFGLFQGDVCSADKDD